ncbi:MAG: homocysteine S-methyltransferase [Thermoleophilia bacterium]|nr:homocysteine S-methyltransferase [Thermoleophilia bacterium]
MRIHDGAYGTLLAAHLHGDETVDDLCLRAPNLVVDAHRAYLDAGAGAIQTNAFLAHLRGSDRRRRELRHGALACAREAVGSAGGDDAPIVFATIGPDRDDARAFWEPIEQALEEDVRGVLCETVTDVGTARAFAAAWAEVGAGVRGVDVLLGCSVAPSRGPDACRWVLDLASELPDELSLGLNCCEGPDGLRDVLEAIAEQRERVWAMPSAGIPRIEPGAPPVWPHASATDWAGAVLEQVEDLPVHALGGCCGTSPDFVGALVAR